MDERERIGRGAGIGQGRENTAPVRARGRPDPPQASSSACGHPVENPAGVDPRPSGEDIEVTRRRAAGDSKSAGAHPAQKPPVPASGGEMVGKSRDTEPR